MVEADWAVTPLAAGEGEKDRKAVVGLAVPTREEIEQTEVLGDSIAEMKDELDWIEFVR